MKRRHMCICSIPFNSIDHDLDLVFLQKEPGLRGIFWKVDQEDVTKNRDDDGYNAFPDEDP